MVVIVCVGMCKGKKWCGKPGGGRVGLFKREWLEKYHGFFYKQKTAYEILA